jgi:hypothetical protein
MLQAAIPGITAAVAYAVIRSFGPKDIGSLYPKDSRPRYIPSEQAMLGVAVVYEVVFWGALISFIVLHHTRKQVSAGLQVVAHGVGARTLVARC